MKQFGWSFLALVFPWIALLFKDNPIAAFLALALQATIIGWIPAAIWAWRVVHKDQRPKTPKKPKTKQAKTVSHE